MSEPLLFSPWHLRGVKARNRVVVSPMCMYASPDGRPTDYHLVHLGRFALGGAGIVIAEATAVEPRGRISSADLGLWSDDQVEGYRRLTRFLKEYGAVPGIQLAHAGRKAATAPPWRNLQPLTAKDAELGDPPWPVVGASATSAGPDWQTPHELSTQEVASVVKAWGDAARRAAEAGFEVIDLHGAHGYLLHTFQSPLSNQRTDRYGGSFENRIRFPLEVVDAIRAAIPESCVLAYRISVMDGIEGGLTMEDSVAFCRALQEHGVDVIDTSSGGVVADRRTDTRIRRGFAFHAPYSREIRQATNGQVATVGLIVDAVQAEAVLRAGDADLVFIGRELMSDPNWPVHAQSELEGIDFSRWHKEASFWLDKRHRILQSLMNEGETPMTRYQPAG